MTKKKIKEPLQRYENTLFFSMSDKANGDDIDNDLLMEGDLKKLAAGLAQQMVRHPEIVWVLEEALCHYDNLIKEK